MPAKKRQEIDTGTDKRYVRRDDQGQFTGDQVDVGKSLSDDRRQHAKTISKPGQETATIGSRSHRGVRWHSGSRPGQR